MRKCLKFFTSASLCLLVWSCFGFATEENNLQDKSDKSSKKSRFIPVELFTGIKWDGKHELTLKEASTSTSACDSASGKRCTTYNISGPFKTERNDTKIEWAGDEIPYYLRTFRTRSFGDVESFFTINNSRDGLVRIFDKRKNGGLDLIVV